MSTTTYLVNRGPAPASWGKVNKGVRCGLRADSLPILPSSINMYVGFGNAHYEPTDVPEALDEFHFSLDTLLGNPDGEVTREIESGWLKIEKAGDPADNLKGTYFFGRLESPADPDAVIMAEFQVKITSADIDPAPTGDQFTGVLFGFFINDNGLVVRFYHNNSNERWLEVFDADQNSTQRVNHSALTYKTNPATFDWNAADVTYKILWDPEADIMRVIRSSGETGLDCDEVLIDGKVSDFPAIPSDQRREHQPIAFFGHAYPGTNSISRWKGAWLYNDVFYVVKEGAFRGGQEGFIKSIDLVHLDVTESPDDNPQAWLALPDVYDDIGGRVRFGNDYVALERTDKSKSFGFYREERNVEDGVLIEFEVDGWVTNQDSGMQASGFEIYVDDGVKAVRVGFLYNLLNYKVGILGVDDADRIGSYTGDARDWTSKRRYRLVFDQVNGARLYEVAEIEGEITINPLGTIGGVPYIDLPDSSLPALTLGILHNALVGGALAQFSMYSFWYMVNARIYEAISGLPPAPWSKVGSGNTYLENDQLVIEDDSNSTYTRYERREALFTWSVGVSVDFRMKIAEYTTEEGTNLIRSNTGVGLVLDDGTYKVVISFAEAGPELGKVVYLSSEDDTENMLFNIRANKKEAEGLYYQLDWTSYHIYRIERTVGGKVRLFLDGASSPVVDFEFPYFPFPSSEDSISKVAFGSISNSVQNKSYWTHVIHNLSFGFDLYSDKLASEREMQDRFSKVVNVIALAAPYYRDGLYYPYAKVFDTVEEWYEDFEEDWPDVGPIQTEFSGMVQLFDPAPEEYEDFEETDWPDVGPIQTEFNGTVLVFDTATENYEDYEEDWLDVGDIKEGFSGTALNFDT